MSNTLNHTSSRQIVRHYTQPESGIKRLMQKIPQVNDCCEFICFKFEFITQAGMARERAGKYALAQSGGKKYWYGYKELRITREMKQCFN
ncbi:hypothetical protein [Escherichia marmotae]|uniref:hypothetical protein n=1 Tax=Escherichia marmotae TaxID=1499973 RepID=UPI003A5BB9C2